MHRKSDHKCLAPSDTSTTQSLNLRVREHWGRGERKIVRAREPGSLLWYCVSQK